jgi:hypothetical protein
MIQKSQLFQETLHYVFKTMYLINSARLYQVLCFTQLVHFSLLRKRQPQKNVHKTLCKI